MNILHIRTCGLINGAGLGTTEYPHANKWIWIPLSHHTQKLLKIDHTPKCMSYNYRTPRKKNIVGLSDLDSGKTFLVKGDKRKNRENRLHQN